jgi:3-oxoacyl-[acyl-carrier protein] reductase
MAGPLQGKVALVTGGSGGIGAAAARRLAADGAKVAVHYHRNAAPAEALAQALQGSGAGAVAVGGDAASPDGARAIVEQAVAAFGRIDILVNGAGTLQNIPFGEVTVETYREQFDSNVLSAILMMQAAVPHFPESGGRIVNICTNISQSPLPGTAVYCAAKSALETLTLGFAKELGPRGITVNALAPGAIETRMTDWLTDEMRQGIIAATPLRRMGQPQDVADAIAFLASDDSRWVTGRTLIIDGGLI